MGDSSAVKRNVNIDLIKCAALFLVVAVHSLRGLRFYDLAPDFSAFSLVFTALRQVFICGVPLFLLSTGYLCCEKQIKIGKEWLLKLLRIIIPFVVTTAVLIVYYMLKDIEHNPFEMLFGFEKYSYAWYVEMYIGLYLLMPFINLAYSALQTKRNKLILIGIMIILTEFPSLLSPSWDISLDYWTVLYPITFYLIGGYINEYGVSISGIKLLIIVPVCILCNTVLLVLEGKFMSFQWNLASDYNSIFVMITAVCIFSVLIKKDTVRTNGTVKAILKTVSNATLSAYLFSKLFDLTVYDYIGSGISSDFTHNFYCMPVAVIIVFVFSVAVGIPLQKLSSVITQKIIKK